MKRILVIVPFFLPGFRGGGPIRSVHNIVQFLGDEFEFSILTSDRDLGDSSSYPDIPTDRWIRFGKAKVRYCSPAMLRGPALAATLSQTPHDLLYLNSFFSFRFSIVPLLAQRMKLSPAAPTVLAPRGEFSAGALALKSHKKKAFIRIGSAIGLFSSLHWHASTAHEARDITAAIGVGADRLSIASNLTAPLPDTLPQHTPRVPGDPLRVVFVSRISPKKNLEFALKVMSGINFPIHFSIVGPEEDAAYYSRCKELAQLVPSNIFVQWVGGIPAEQIPQLMSNHDLLFLPSLGENFGHVIAEALGAGTPVLLSDTTPWRGLTELGVGYDLPLDQPDLFRKALYDKWRQSQAQASEMRTRASSYARERQRNGADVEANRTLFHTALAASQP